MSARKKNPPTKLSAPLRRIIEARHNDPFEVLGRHVAKKEVTVRAFLPHASNVMIKETGTDMERIPGSDMFVWSGANKLLPERYQLTWKDDNGMHHKQYDPYCFPPMLEGFDLHTFQQGNHWHAYRFLGAKPRTIDDISGTLFAVWAPNAQRVSVVGNFNRWDGRVHPMRSRGESGIWELFLPGIEPRAMYKFEILSQSGDVLLKSDPYGNQFQHRPENACIITPDSAYEWQDTEWLQRRQQIDWQHSPISIYEVHLGSWQRDEQGNFLNYRELAERLCPYVLELGFTHTEVSCSPCRCEYCDKSTLGRYYQCVGRNALNCGRSILRLTFR
jgi:1,4-alpha-glucan branching enzyme